MDRPKNLNSHGIYVHATRGYLPPAAARARVGIAAAAGDSDISLTDIRRELMENGETGPPRMRGWDVQETPWEAMHKWDGLAPAAHTIPQLVRHCWDTATWLDDIGALDGIATMPRLLRLERDMTAHSIGHILAKHIYDSIPEKLGHDLADVLKWVLVELNVMRLNQNDDNPRARLGACPRTTGLLVALEACRLNHVT